MPRIVHFGIGNFHRAHQAWYTQLANAQNHTDQPWRISAVSLRSAEVRDALAPQDNRYTLVTKSSSDTRFDTIAVHDNIWLGSTDRAAILDAIAQPDTAMITATVSEKGYCIDPQTQRLALADPVIAAELQSGDAQSLIGYVAHGLARRADSHAKPITVMSCDNLSANSRCLKSAVLDFCTATGLIQVEPYIAASVSFPDTMVDRITPATTDQLRQEVAEHLQASASVDSDALPVSTEPFSEWIIEHNFAGPHPAWDRAGAEFVTDVMPYELRKLRLLNGSHSLLAYAGSLAGHSYVHQAIADSTLRSWVSGLMIEATETLAPSIQAQAPAYCEALIQRFSNSSLHHALAQIACDGSLKIPIRLLSMMRERELLGLNSPHGHRAVDSWLSFVIQQCQAGIELQDPQAEELIAIVVKGASEQETRLQILSLLEPDLELAQRWSQPCAD